jgi:hypothetical protein
VTHTNDHDTNDHDTNDHDTNDHDTNDHDTNDHDTDNRTDRTVLTANTVHIDTGHIDTGQNWGNTMYALELSTEIRPATEDRTDERTGDRTNDLAVELQVTAALRSKARCRDLRGSLTRLFFSEELYDIARAKAICSKCAVRDLCLQGALDREEPWGVWGGELLVNGRIVANKRPRGRPPRTPRPELVVEEVPIPA